MLRARMGSGREVFTRLKAGPDRVAAAAARQQLEDLETLQKYGVRPQHAGESEPPAGAASTPSAGTDAPVAAATAAQVQSQTQDEESEIVPKPAAVKPGTTGPVQFLKGKIVSSDCSKPPGDGDNFERHDHLHHAYTDYKSLLVIGADQFFCDWKNRWCR